jgi:uncharacterized protein (DUF1330 family)
MRPVRITARLWIKHGKLASFQKFESTAFTIMNHHGGRVLSVTKNHHSNDGQPHETHTLQFPDVRAFETYKTDPALIALAPLRESCIAKTEVVIHQNNVT